ncbi:MAG TPA: YtcA family lipoprotein [Candidatus Sulfotelmatobacter sp.]|nr:YtcA family lipoprotein [Candidatus Sulfotelmatobacter sp.]
MNPIRRYLRGVFVPALLLMMGCGQAPSFDIMGSFFPAWLVCLAVAIVLTVVSRALLSRYVAIVWPVLIYPSLTAIFAFVLWLVLYR